MEYKLYHYNPSLAAAVIFVILFVCSTGLHAFQLFRKKTFYFTPFIIGGIFETVGYAGRAISAHQSPDWTLIPYVMQSLLLLLGPTLYAASVYMVLGRIIRLTKGESHSIIKPQRLTKLFVLGDVVSFLAQSGGGGMMANAKTAADQEKGQHIITVGLVIQIVFFGFFIIVAGLFHRRISMYPTSRSKDPLIPWERLQYVLYGGSCMIMVRSIYRLIEYVQGDDGVLMKTEVYLYVFDAALMFITSLLFNIFHPGQVITQEALEKEDSYMLGTVSP
ncbi:uncharacterized protein LTHEOB_4213 [Lasiodiplodia theobromae]|uniref:uncharacterized protein n=1 Tax=Lasiodiplodia theobromae TaxID=45133 RepID=UPI0015C337E4|nr:uncharacterized protein LTHEOB_4213 [Lasiodiplodia theobromae]KAF4546216.1 hypothetical protein LTHEOB_4213 [Lasiodiplodia theobromae]